MEENRGNMIDKQSMMVNNCTIFHDNQYYTLLPMKRKLARKPQFTTSLALKAVIKQNYELFHALGLFPEKYEAVFEVPPTN